MKKEIRVDKSGDTDRIIRRLLMSVYVLLAIFGIISMLSPGWLKGLSKIGREAEARIMHDYGNSFITKGNYEMAALQYQKAIQIYPQMSEAYINLGIACKSQMNLDDAMMNFNKALTFKGIALDNIYFHMAEIYALQNNPQMAVQYFLKSAECAPFPQNAFQKAGEILNNTAQWQKSKEVFDSALVNACNMKNCYLGMLKRDYYLFTKEEVRKDILSLLHKGYDPQKMVCYDEHSFNQALTRDDQMAGIYNQYGYLYAMTGDYRKAAESFALALQIKPDFMQARDNMNAAYHKLNSEKGVQ